jgi:hypothetical protein
MRAAISAFLVVASCSKPVPVVAVPNETKPSAATANTTPAGRWKFVLSTHHEISCSQSFEADGTYVTFDLAIANDGAAKLTVEGIESHTFGPSDAKMSPGSKIDRHVKDIRESWSGHADGTRIDLEANDKHWFLECKAAKIDARVPYAEGADTDATKQVDALACTPPRHVPRQAETEVTRLLFVTGAGIEHRIDDYGWGSARSELRLAK